MNNTSYHPIAKFCHWAIVLVVAVQFVSSWLMAEPRHGETLNMFNFIHVSAWSLIAIILVGLMFFMRFYKPVTRSEEGQKGLAPKLAIATQYALYILLLIVPISGWIMLSIRHVAVDFFGLFDLPVILASNPSLLFALGKMHGNLANLLGILALAHIGATLYHHFILKDSVWNRMRPAFLKVGGGNQ